MGNILQIHLSFISIFLLFANSNQELYFASVIIPSLTAVIQTRSLTLNLEMLCHKQHLTQKCIYKWSLKDICVWRVGCLPSFEDHAVVSISFLIPGIPMHLFGSIRNAVILTLLFSFSAAYICYFSWIILLRVCHKKWIKFCM